MGRTEKLLAGQAAGGGGTPETEGAPKAGRPRVRIDGKFFARGQERLRVQGVTYGPFAPNLPGEPFPPPDVVAYDFARMQDAGVNAVRTYYVPPEWLLYLADDRGMNV